MPDSVCPECYSHPRHRSYSISLKNIFSEQKKKKLKVLHFAPEGQIVRLLQSYPDIDYLSVDINHQNAMRKEDIQALSFVDNSFDVIICLHVFEHILDDKKAMQEVFRVLKPDGVALLDVPIDTTRNETYEDPSITSPQGRTDAFWQWDHLRLYGLDYASKLSSVGFRVEEKKDLMNLKGNDVQRFCLEITPNFVCYKK